MSFWQCQQIWAISSFNFRGCFVLLLSGTVANRKLQVSHEKKPGCLGYIYRGLYYSYVWINHDIRIPIKQPVFHGSSFWPGLFDFVSCRAAGGSRGISRGREAWWLGSSKSRLDEKSRKNGVILLMVQKSQESQDQPLGMVLKPCKQWAKLPVSHPCCRILSINRIGGAI